MFELWIGQVSEEMYKTNQSRFYSLAQMQTNLFSEITYSIN